VGERCLYRCKASSITPSEMRVWRCTPFNSSLEKSVSKKRCTFCDRRVQIVYKSSSGSSAGADAGVKTCGSCPASAFCKEEDVELVVAAATIATIATPAEFVLFSMMPLLIPAVVASFLICAVVVVAAVVTV